MSVEYATLVYRGFWFSPEREALQKLVDAVNEPVTGTARLRLFKGSATLIGRSSPRSLYRNDIVTFEDDRGAYDQRDAGGFIRLNALRLRTTAMVKDRGLTQPIGWVDGAAYDRRRGPRTGAGADPAPHGTRRRGA